MTHDYHCYTVSFTLSFYLARRIDHHLTDSTSGGGVGELVFSNYAVSVYCYFSFLALSVAVVRSSRFIGNIGWRKNERLNMRLIFFF